MYQQFSLFELAEYEPDFTPDCWSTPDDVAQRIIVPIKPSDRKSHATSAREMGELVHTKLNEPGYPEVVALNTSNGV